MQFTSQYQSPLGEILLATDETGFTGLWFYGQKHFAQILDADHETQETPVLQLAKDGLINILPEASRTFPFQFI